VGAIRTAERSIPKQPVGFWVALVDNIGNKFTPRDYINWVTISDFLPRSREDQAVRSPPKINNRLDDGIPGIETAGDPYVKEDLRRLFGKCKLNTAKDSPLLTSHQRSEDSDHCILPGMVTCVASRLWQLRIMQS